MSPLAGNSTNFVDSDVKSAKLCLETADLLHNNPLFPTDRSIVTLFEPCAKKKMEIFPSRCGKNGQ
jgi:hypothetical protein